MQLSYILNAITHQLEPLQRSDKTRIEIDGRQVDVGISHHNNNHCELFISGTTYDIYVAQDDNKIFIHLDGKSWQVDTVDGFSASQADQGSGDGRAVAPMPGVVVEVNVKPDQRVSAGQCLMLIESMKLQAEIKAPIAGLVSAVNFAAGDSFNKAETLVSIAAEVNNDQAVL